jgi:Transcriptional regulator of a riboflavin/FAD biosynthetic operon
MELDGVLVISEPGARQKTRGEFGPFITENATVFRQHFGVVLFPGSLNVYVAQPPGLQKDLDTGKLPPAFVVPRGELSGNPNYVGDGQAWRCTLHSDKIPSPVNCWIFRRINSRVSSGVIELVAAVSLVKTYHLRDGDPVVIRLV